MTQSTFPAEINIHFSGIENLTKPTVWAFPTLLVCLDCGFVEFVTGEDALRQLKGSETTHGHATDRHTMEDRPGKKKPNRQQKSFNN